MSHHVTPGTCETCRSILVNPVVPGIFIDRQNATGYEWKWRKSGQEVTESIQNGCLMCARLQRRFNDGARTQFNSKLFDTTGSIHLIVGYLEVGPRWIVALYPEDESSGGWLTYDLFPSTGMQIDAKCIILFLNTSR
jgi:hypothetical protein